VCCGTRHCMRFTLDRREQTWSRDVCRTYVEPHCTALKCSGCNGFGVAILCFSSSEALSTMASGHTCSVRVHLAAHRFVAIDTDGTVLGWIAASPVSSRCVYVGVLEHSVYVHPSHHGRAVGRTLLGTYIAATEAAGVWTLQSGIFPENTASLALHGSAGFRVVGTREPSAGIMVRGGTSCSSSVAVRWPVAGSANVRLVCVTLVMAGVLEARRRSRDATRGTRLEPAAPRAR
jgi:L-amino acid N-acyltransferase YncA